MFATFLWDLLHNCLKEGRSNQNTVALESYKFTRFMAAIPAATF